MEKIRYFDVDSNQIFDSVRGNLAAIRAILAAMRDSLTPATLNPPKPDDTIDLDPAELHELQRRDSLRTMSRAEITEKLCSDLVIGAIMDDLQNS